MNAATGQPDPDRTAVIGLTDVDGLAVKDPRTIAVSPRGDRAYVYADTQSYGEGLVAINIRARRADGFIPLSGANVGGNGPAPPVFRSRQPRPPMVVSKDGRLVYVAAGLDIRIVNVEERLVVSRFEDLPSQFNYFAMDFTGVLETRLTDLTNTIKLGAATGVPGTRISALELSPDGRRLFVVVQNGGGAGSQPGNVMVVDVDLYRDADPADDLQSNLEQYLTTPAFFGTPSAAIPASDEPSDAAISPDGRYLYLVNGGVSAFSAPVNGAQALQYALRVASESTTGNLVIDPNVREQVVQDLDQGFAIVSAPGVIEGFEAAGVTQATARPRFSSSVNHGWQPDFSSGGLVLSQARFPSVYASRPSNMTIRPDGQRALVSFFQTGNFGYSISLLKTFSRPRR